MNWPLIAMLIVVGLLSAVWIAYGFMHAFNGLMYEIGVLRRFLSERA